MEKVQDINLDCNLALFWSACSGSLPVSWWLQLTTAFPLAAAAATIISKHRITNQIHDRILKETMIIGRNGLGTGSEPAQWWEYLCRCLDLAAKIAMKTLVLCAWVTSRKGSKLEFCLNACTCFMCPALIRGLVHILTARFAVPMPMLRLRLTLSWLCRIQVVPHNRNFIEPRIMECDYVHFRWCRDCFSFKSACSLFLM